MSPAESAHTRFMHGTAKSASVSTRSRPLVACPISIPAALASGASLATIACAPTTGARPAGSRHPAGECAGVLSGAGLESAERGSGVGVPTSVAPLGRMRESVGGVCGSGAGC